MPSNNNPSRIIEQYLLNYPGPEQMITDEDVFYFPN